MSLNLVPAAAFSAFHFQLFTFPYAFQFKQGDQHSPSQTPAGQYSSGTFFSFQLGAENHHVHNHRKMLLIQVVHVDNDKQEACRSQGRVVELPIVLNWCIHVCKGRIGMGRVIGFVLSEMEGHEIFQKTDEKYPSLPPPPPPIPRQLKTTFPKPYPTVKPL